ncbi:HAD family hydrolase [Geofilum rubicundum]|uniref:Haloacid dehalogenase-like hydrolase n=1 Tax=Geofilum rubicundum JCM 15548 TaxID=1236989 RepID=A0A0E9LTZ9_9BACT|nr:HAD family phosphatase [Geofilum rubicundum]GAO28335.1 haloacid dehalogenase-like hydrolase [Geofilum rubicundum JCM 15548]
MRILNIIFDLGGVIVDLDMSRTFHAFNRFFGESAVELENGYLKSKVLRQYETGAIDTETFLSELLQLAKNGESRGDIVAAWNAMLVRIPEERLRMLEQLRQSHRIFILSNTNELHEDYFEKMAPGYDRLSDLFEKAYYSHRIGCRKPDSDAFKAVLADSGLRAEETLFVDDLADNISTAKKLNFQTLHITQGMEVSNILKTFL